MKGTKGNSKVRMEDSIDKFCLLHGFALGHGGSWLYLEKSQPFAASRCFQFASAGGELPEPVGKTQNLRFYQFSSKSPRTSMVHLDLQDSPAFLVYSSPSLRKAEG